MQQVGPDHIVAELLHVKILRDVSNNDPQSAFSAQIVGPGIDTTIQIGNGVTKDLQLSGVQISGIPANPTIRMEVDNFRLVPPGATPQNASALAFLLVFKLIEIFKITIGSVPVTAALR